MNKDLLSHLAKFLTYDDCFKFSTVSKEWNLGMQYQKSKAVKKAVKDMQLLHACQNICPCLLKALLNQNDFILFPNKLDHIACQYDNKKSAPQWFLELLHN